MAKNDWPLVALGGLILVGGTLSPVPEDLVTTPIALALIAKGTGVI